MKKYFGPETEKALANFAITGASVDIRFIYAVVKVKIAAANVNYKRKLISNEVHSAILKSCEEILEGKFDSQFPTDSVQGGAGTSINMNVNEVIAKRANEIMVSKDRVHYLEHVNLSQSTNDVLPTALRLLVLQLIDEYLKSLKKLENSFSRKGRQFKNIIKVGRTHLQDAVPISLGAEFKAYASFVRRDINRLKAVKRFLLETNLGGTAIGTGINTPPNYSKDVNIELAKLTGYKFRSAKDLVDATQNLDTFLHVMSMLQISSLGLSKISNDLKLMASGPRAGFNEIKLPELQQGSSIMPGKNNPVVFEAVNQVSNHIAGNATACSLALLEGQLELNTMLPTFIKALTESFDMLLNMMPALIKTVEKTDANEEQCRQLLDGSLVFATKLSKFIGHQMAGELAREAIKKNTSLKSQVVGAKILSKKEIEVIFEK